MRAAVLGTGPSGLLAADACAAHGVPVALYGPEPDFAAIGPRFLLVPIFDEGGRHEAVMSHTLRGDLETWRKKAYGEDGPVVSRRWGNYRAWSLRRACVRIWGVMSQFAFDTDWNGRTVAAWFHVEAPRYDVVFSSIPLPVLCRGASELDVAHRFRSREVRVAPEALEDVAGMLDDGTEDRSWYRVTQAFGAGTTEWGPGAPVPPLPRMRTEERPVATNCGCRPDVVRVGSEGEWKELPEHHAFNRAVEEIVRRGKP